MYIYDSSRKEKVLLEPIRDNEVSIYVCGPTVYDDAHLGHARSALSFDLLRRTLETLGYSVRFAKNFTDIDDKIIKKMNETGKSLEEITSYYMRRYLEEMDELKVLRADMEPRATESIEAIESMIEDLLERGCAYRTENGDVYFDTSVDSRYGSVSGMTMDDSDSRSRVCSLITKKNPKDFSLWKACGDTSTDVCFDSPLGRGRPGWHIECSAMIEKFFDGDGNYTIDIHGGGADLLFPHHENEAAQTRCATGHEIAKYWMHNGFVQIDGEKMSKSLGNSFFLKDALSVYGGELLRFYLIGVHYRNDFNFNEEDIQSAKKRLDKIYRLKKRILPSRAGDPDANFVSRLKGAMADDLNSSAALAIIDEMIGEANEKLDADAGGKEFKRKILGNLAFVDRLMGIGGEDPYLWFQHGVSEKEREKIESLISLRTQAKREKDFERADIIRNELEEMGVSLMDTPEGTKWEKSRV